MIERFATALNHYTYLTGVAELITGKPKTVRLELSSFNDRFNVWVAMPAEFHTSASKMIEGSPYMIVGPYGTKPDEQQIHIQWDEVIP